MSIPAASTAGSAAALSLPQRFIGILFSPKATFESVVSWPRWVGILALTTLLFTIFQGGLFMSEVGQQAMLDRMAEQMSGEQLKQMSANIRIIAMVQTASILVIGPLFVMLLAGIFMGVFTLVGGTATYKQVLAVVAHAGVVSTTGGIFSAVLNYFRESITSPTNLMVFLPGLEENSFLGGFLGTIDLVFIWWVFVLAIGLAVLYRRRTQPIFLSLMAVYALIACAVGAYKSVSGG